MAQTTMEEFLCPLKDLTVAASSLLVSASPSAQSSYLLKQRNKTKRAEELFAVICCLQGSGKTTSGNCEPGYRAERFRFQCPEQCLAHSKTGASSRRWLSHAGWPGEVNKSKVSTELSSVVTVWLPADVMSPRLMCDRPRSFLFPVLPSFFYHY